MFVVFVLGCGGGDLIHAPAVAMGTPDVEIVGVDADFQIGPQASSTPFAGADTECFLGRGRIRGGGQSGDTAVQAWPAALKNGARRVRVRYPGMDEPLYGVLQLCAMPAHATPEPARSEYLIRVSENDVETTHNGTTSVVTERIWDGSHYYSWILWLSRKPLVSPTA